MSFVWFDTFFQANKSNSSHFLQRIRIPLYTFPWNHQLYFIPVFICTFIKVKSNWGKNRDGYAIAKWFRPFSLLAAKTYKRPEAKGRSPLATPIKHKIPYSESKNIRESNLDFTAHLGEINPDMPYLCRRGSSGPERAVFAFFPSVRRESMKKNVKSSIFRKKQVNFWAVYLLRCKLLIINKNTMMYRQMLLCKQPYKL